MNDYLKYPRISKFPRAISKLPRIPNLWNYHTIDFKIIQSFHGFQIFRYIYINLNDYLKYPNVSKFLRIE